jgi:hypothetical protein
VKDFRFERDVLEETCISVVSMRLRLAEALRCYRGGFLVPQRSVQVGACISPAGIASKWVEARGCHLEGSSMKERNAMLEYLSLSGREGINNISRITAVIWCQSRSVAFF